MNTPLDEKALKAVRTMLGERYYTIYEGELEKIIQTYLEATRAGESEAVETVSFYIRDESIKKSRRLCYGKEIFDGWVKVSDIANKGWSLFTLGNPPSLAAVQADNERLRNALEPFSEMAGELFAQNYQDYDIIASVKGKTDMGSHVKLELAFKAFRTARAALAGQEKQVS